MIDYQTEDIGAHSVLVRIVEGSWNGERWEKLINDLNESEKDVIFEINHFDIDGLFLLILKRWANDKIVVKVRTNSEQIKYALDFNLGKKVMYVN